MGVRAVALFVMTLLWDYSMYLGACRRSTVEPDQNGDVRERIPDERPLEHGYDPVQVKYLGEHGCQHDAGDHSARCQHLTLVHLTPLIWFSISRATEDSLSASDS